MPTREEPVGLEARLQAWTGLDVATLRKDAVRRLQALREYLSGGEDDIVRAAPGWLRPKGNLTRGELGIVLAVALLPLLIMFVRIAGLPGVLGSTGWLGALGYELDQALSLHQIPANDRNRVLYLLFLPTGAMLIAFTRLTLGIRVIGFRSILIAVGFQQSGVAPSLILIAVVVLIVVGVRPTLVRIRLPYYARVSVIMCIGVIVLLSALLVAPWAHSDVLWRVGFFPVLVLGLLAEGIAKTLDRDSGVTAAFRTGMTIGIALLLAGVGQIPLLQEIKIHFPELVITQMIAIILISEFLDLRLFQDWDARLSGVALPKLFGDDPKLRVAIVCNRRRPDVVAKRGPKAEGGYAKAAVRRIVAELRARGHTVKRVDGDSRMLSQLQGFLPPHPRTREPGGIVLDLSHGVQGELAALQVPAMLEMAGFSIVGAGPRGHWTMHDRIALGEALEAAGLRGPGAVRVLDGSAPSGLSFPVRIRPRVGGGDAPSWLANDADELERLVDGEGGAAELVAEPAVAGREIRIALLGNEALRCLPPVEADTKGNRELACPAELDTDSAHALRAAARRAFHACACRDFALVTLRISRSGKIRVVEVAERGVLEPGGAFEVAAGADGLSFGELLDEILVIARRREQVEPTAAAPFALPQGQVATGGVR